jgi:hypothetical protein
MGQLRRDPLPRHNSSELRGGLPLHPVRYEPLEGLHRLRTVLLLLRGMVLDSRMHAVNLSEIRVEICPTG